MYVVITALLTTAQHELSTNASLAAKFTATYKKKIKKNVKKNWCSFFKIYYKGIFRLSILLLIIFGWFRQSLDVTRRSVFCSVTTVNSIYLVVLHSLKTSSFNVIVLIQKTSIFHNKITVSM